MKSLGKLKTAHLLILPFLSFLTTKYNPYPFIISYHLNIEKITATETRLIPEHNHFLYSDFFQDLQGQNGNAYAVNDFSGIRLSHIFEIPSMSNEKPSISIQLPTISNLGF